MKNLSIVILLVLLQACAGMKTKAPDVIATPSSTATPVVVVNEGNKIALKCDSTCTGDETVESTIIADKVNQIKDGSCFIDYFTNPKNGLDLTQTNGKTATQVAIEYAKKSGVVGLSYYYKSRNFFTHVIEVGKDIGDGTVYANRNAYSGFALTDKVQAIIHEMGHGLGYTHDYSNTVRRSKSVPYFAQEAAGACFK